MGQIDGITLRSVHPGDINNRLLYEGTFDVEKSNIKFHHPDRVVKDKRGNDCIIGP